MATRIKKSARGGRRAFLSLLTRATAVVAGLLGPGKLAASWRNPGTQATGPIPNYDWGDHRWAFGVDATRCIGCLRCVEACKAENSVYPDAHHFRTWVERYAKLPGQRHAEVDSQAGPRNIAAAGSERHFRFDTRYRDEVGVRAFFVPKLCNQCTNPPCVQVCPTGATFSTEDGIVLVDPEHCIGCQYCVQACPYGARFLNPVTHVAEKCTWCYHRITKGLQPACVEACPVNARIFGDLNDVESPISHFLRDNRVDVLKPETGNEPNVYYVGIDMEVR